MSSPKTPLQRAARRGLWLAVFLLVFALLRVPFATMSTTRGLVTPSGSVDTGFLIFGFLVLGMRFAALFVVPFLAVEGVLRALLEELSRRRTSDRGSSSSPR